MPELSEALQSCAERAGVSLEPRQVERLMRYLRLLDRWNRTIRLTGLSLSGFPTGTLDRLVGEGLAAASLAPEAGVWIDLASGGGSPAVPIRILRPGLMLTMVESRQRKAAFLREVVRELELADTEVLPTRFEELPRDVRVDLVTARAVRLDEPFFETVARLLVVGGRLVLFLSESTPPPSWRGLDLTESLAFSPTESVLHCYKRIAVGHSSDSGRQTRHRPGRYGSGP